MSDLYKKTSRGYLIDHHSPAPPVVTFENLNIDEYEQFFKEANINNLMLYTKDHWGYSYFDTKIGTRHPALKEDWIAQVAPVLRKLDIEFNAYYCIEYDTLAPSQHPEWGVKDQENVNLKLKGRMAKWGVPCYETGYRDYVLGQLKEVASYKPDSLFLDIFGKTLCYCHSCTKKFKDKYGYDLPRDATKVESEIASLDFGDKGRDVNQFLEDCASSMLQDVIDAVKGVDPSIKITINFAALYPKKIRDMLDYQFTEPWAGNWLSAAYSRDTAVNQYPQLGPGDVSEVYNYRSDSIYELAAAQIAAQGCRVFMYSGSQHVDGTLEHVEAQKVGKAYREVEQFEDYLHNREVIADVAIVQSDLSSMSKAGNYVVINAIGRCKRSDIHRQAVLGAMKLCDLSKMSWKVLPEQNVNEDGLHNIKTIILAGVYHISESLKNELEKFVKNGGAIISDGGSGLYDINGSIKNDFELSEILGCSFDHILDNYINADWGGYIKMCESPIWKNVPRTTPPMTSFQYGVKTSSGKSCGSIVYPAVPLTDTTWVNWWCPPPKTTPSEFSAVVENDYGDGKSIYLAFDFFRSVNESFYQCTNIFNGILNYLLPNPRLFLSTDNTETIGYVGYSKDDYLIIHNLSHLAEKVNGDTPLISGGKLVISKALMNCKNATVIYPEKQELLIVDSGDTYTIQLPELRIHQIIIIK